jgi:protein TonB
MRSRASASQVTLLILGAALAALPAKVQETLAQISEPNAPASAKRSADGSEGALPARVTTGYPARALRDDLTGTVGLTVTVTPEGRATDCVVTQSSGHAELDHAACKEIEEKARFSPAIDEKGDPISAQFSTKITFRIK